MRSVDAVEIQTISLPRSIEKRCQKPFRNIILFNGEKEIPQKCLPDTGSDVSILPISTYETHFPEIELQKWDGVKCRNFDGSAIKSRGWLPNAECSDKGKIISIGFPVCDRPGAILGVDAMNALGMGIAEATSIESANVQEMDKPKVELPLIYGFKFFIQFKKERTTLPNQSSRMFDDFHLHLRSQLKKKSLHCSSLT